MNYTSEVENMCCVAKGANHGPAPIPEEGKWVKATEIKDISGLTHGVGWCAPQQGACKLTLNVKNWQFGGEDSPEYACIRDVIRLRYRLLPYLYSTAAQACRDGLPMIRAMLTAFPEEPDLYGIGDQYMLGDALLVRPVTQALKDR